MPASLFAGLCTLWQRCELLTGRGRPSSAAFRGLCTAQQIARPAANRRMATSVTFSKEAEQPVKQCLASEHYQEQQ